MATKYASEAADALTDIQDAGAPVTFPSGSPPVYDAATDTWSADTRGTASSYALQVKSDPDRLAALGLVLANPVTLLVAASGLAVTPAPGMAMTWAGLTYTIKLVEAVAPDGTAILYRCTGET